MARKDQKDQNVRKHPKISKIEPEVAQDLHLDKSILKNDQNPFLDFTFLICCWLSPKNVRPIQNAVGGKIAPTINQVAPKGSQEVSQALSF